MDALEAAAGEILRRVGVEQPAKLVLAGLGREITGEGVADEEGGVLAEEGGPVLGLEGEEAAVALGEGREVLRDPEDVAGEVEFGEGGRVAGVERVQRLVEVRRQGALKW